MQWNYWLLESSSPFACAKGSSFRPSEHADLTCTCFGGSASLGRNPGLLRTIMNRVSTGKDSKRLKRQTLVPHEPDPHDVAPADDATWPAPWS